MSTSRSTDTEDSIVLHSTPQILNFEEALSRAGSEHNFQKRLMILMALQRICLGFLFTTFPFLFKQPKFQCIDETNANYYICEPTPDTCKRGLMPIPGSDNSLITFFELYCDNAPRAELIKNLFTAACSIGVVIIFPLADKLGRRPGLIASYAIGAFSLFLLSFMSTWWAIAFFLSLAGLGLSPFMVNSFLILNEFSNAKMRANASVVISSFWTFGQIAVGVFAYLLSNDWRNLMLLGVGIPSITLLPFLIRWTRESPMFLVSKGRFQDAKEVLNIVAHTNKRQLPYFQFSEENTENREKSSDKIYGFMDLFRYRSLRMNTILGSFICLVLFFNYYGTIFALESIQVNSHMLTVVLAITELFACYISGIMIQKVSRRLSFALCFAACGFANILINFFPVPSDSNETSYQAQVQLVLTIINRFSISIAMAVSGLYISEIFPTSVRAIGSSLIVFVARLGSFIATVGTSMCVSLKINPIMMFGVGCIPAVLVSLIAKETFGLPLPEVIEEDQRDYVEQNSDYWGKWIDTGYLFKIIQKKKNQRNKFTELSLNENPDSIAVTLSPKVKSQSFDTQAGF